MNIVKFLRFPLQISLRRQQYVQLIFRDLFRPCMQPERDHKSHLEACIDWLCRAQDVRDKSTDRGGISAGWSFKDRWLPSYPETSGYIVETFIAASVLLNRKELLDRAQRILDWELSIQNADGSFQGHFGEQDSQPVIFNTGQIIHGLLAGFLNLGREDCLNAAVRAGQWMMQQQDNDGCWRRSVHNGVPHTYNTRAAWALLRVGFVTNELQLVKSAVQNLEWALTQITDSGWFTANAFTLNRAPYLHTIAYAIRGFLESSQLLNEDRYFAVAEKAAKALINVQRSDGWLAGTYGDSWIPKASYACLTGIAQMSIIWKRIFQIEGEKSLLSAIQQSLSYLKKNHVINGRENAVDGGIAGSQPIWGSYSRFEYPNWSTKFFADALMMDMDNISIPMGGKEAKSVSEVEGNICLT